jgi:hypothetical protein
VIRKNTPATTGAAYRMGLFVTEETMCSNMTTPLQTRHRREQ